LDHKNIEKARKLLQQDPVSKNIIEELDKLRKNVPKDELSLFDLFYEAAIVASDYR